MNARVVIRSGDTSIEVRRFIVGIPGPRGPTGATGATGSQGLPGTGSFVGTSTTNLAVGTGTKALVTQAGNAWILGQRLRYSSNDLTKIMDGEVTSYDTNTGDLEIDVDYTEGAGSASAWSISIVGERGASGSISDTTVAALIAIGNAVNTTGKIRNMMKADENERVWRALGALAASPWRALDDPAGIEEITPS